MLFLKIKDETIGELSHVSMDHGPHVGSIRCVIHDLLTYGNTPFEVHKRIDEILSISDTGRGLLFHDVDPFSISSGWRVEKQMWESRIEFTATSYEEVSEEKKKKDKRKPKHHRRIMIYQGI